MVFHEGLQTVVEPHIFHAVVALREDAFRNRPSQKLQQPIFGDVTANEQTSLRQESKPMFDVAGGVGELVDFSFAFGSGIIHEKSPAMSDARRSKSPRQANEGIEIRRGSGDAEVAAEIELSVLVQRVGESRIHLPLPLYLDDEAEVAERDGN